MKTNLKYFSVFFAVTFLYFAHVQADYQAYFSPVDDLDSKIVAELKNSKQSIDVAIYTFSSVDIESELQKAVDRGVQVRILVRKQQSKMKPGFLDNLVKKGVDVRWVTKINHHKFIVIDSKTLLTSSGNFSQTALQKSYDENLLICDTCKEQVDAYKSEFEYVYINSNPLDREADDLENRMRKDNRVLPASPAALFTSLNFETEYDGSRKIIRLKSRDDSSLGKVESYLMDQIAEAKSSIQVATGHLRSYPLYMALAEARKRGVKVEVVLDSQEYVSPYYQAKEDQEYAACKETGKDDRTCYRFGYHFSRKLADSGVDVRFKYYALRWNFIRAPQMHQKYMIIDQEKLFTGSYNWSFNAEFQSLENVVILTEKSVVKSYIENFKNIWSYGAGQFETLKSDLLAEKDELSYFFSPQILKISQIEELKAIACQKCPSVFCPGGPGDDPRDGDILPFSDVEDFSIHVFSSKVKKPKKSSESCEVGK